MALKVIGPILFFLALAVYSWYANKKIDRDYDEWQESERKHEQWMVDFGGKFPQK